MFNVCVNAAKLVNYKWTIVRCISTSSIIHCNHKQQSSLYTSLQDFTPVYKFNLIRQLALVNRLKLYQSIITAVMVPTTLILSALNVLSIEYSMAAGAIGLSGTATLFTVGILTNKLIGFIYVNKEEDTVRIAYADFWGRRKNIHIPRVDIIPICGEHLKQYERIYYKLKRYSVTETYVLNLSHCQVLDRDRFKRIFGIEQ